MRNKIIKTILAVCLIVSTTFSVTACNSSGSRGSNVGDKEKGNRTEITFLCDANSTSQQAWLDLIKAYNDGVGYTKDHVYVTAKMQANASSPSASIFIKNSNYAYNVVAVNDSQNAFQTLAIKRDAKKAPNGYFLDLSSYAAADEDFQKNTINKNLLNWFSMTYNQNAQQGAGKEKHIIGEGQSLLGVPYGAAAHLNWYNEKIFKEQGINIISIPEEDLDEYNKTNNSSIKPHGYAEYKHAPFSGAIASENLAGQTVYKVFNNCIGMNWEEQRNLLKYFTKGWNSSSSSTYGFVSEYWFNYGWSVGGDVMGFDGTEYDFTLMDKSANYIVTKDNTIINGKTYMAGEIVKYEDKVNQADIATMDGVYAIPSQYDAVKEYISLQVATTKVVDTSGGKTYYGYGVATPETSNADNLFNTAQVAMVRGNPASIVEKSQSKYFSDFNITVCETYREYEGGSTYQKDGKSGFENEYLKVIGETYDGEVYTGDLKVVDGTPIVGNQTSASISQALVIPACSDPDKYQAAWNFISWVATEGQKYLAYAGTITPVAYDILFSKDYAYNTTLTKGKNYYAVAKMAYNAGRGDWGYFENGTWVTDWANDFNNVLRRGNETMTQFLDKKADQAKQALNNMYCVIKGIR